MEIVKQKVSLFNEIDTVKALRDIERAGRICYASEDKITQESYKTFVRRLMANKHYSVLEFVDVTLEFTTSIGIARELLRHRHVSALQESTRYIKYDNIGFIRPKWYDTHKEFTMKWAFDVNSAESNYKKDIELGIPPQIARDKLPLCTATRVLVKSNLRNWLHIIGIRSDKAAHPEMRALIGMANDILSELFPDIFGAQE